MEASAPYPGHRRHRGGRRRQERRGSFITPGVIHSRLTPEGEKYCNVLWERYGSDFVCEDGEWKYLHEHVCPDIPGKLDVGNWAHDEYARITDPNPPETMPPTLGDPPPVSDPGPLHMPYSVLKAPRTPCPGLSPTRPWTTTTPIPPSSRSERKARRELPGGPFCPGTASPNRGLYPPLAQV